MNTTAAAPACASPSAWRDGLVAVAIFSGSLPATRLALSGLDPYFLTWARAAIAAAVALLILGAGRGRRPTVRQLPTLALIAGGAVIGFPLFSAFALRAISAAHALVLIGLLPLATAIWAALRHAERPAPLFWLFALVGSALVLLFVGRRDGAALTLGATSVRGDAWMLAAIGVCAGAYAEGARLSRQLGGWQTICWALLLAAPLSVPMTWTTWPAGWRSIAAPAWLGLAYVSLFSMLIGFVFWYRALARGGTTGVSQLQLLQPLLGLALAAVVLGETVDAQMLLVTAAVGLCVAASRRHGARGPQSR